MPGRGANWRGVGEGNQDRIGSGEIEDDSITSEDIKDLTITEADIADEAVTEPKLDTGVKTKLNKTDEVGYDEVKDEGTPLTKRSKLNFIGTGVNAVDNGDTTDVTITQATADGVGYDEIQEEGTPLAKEPAIDFQGAGVTATAGTGKTIVTIPGGGGGGGGVVEKIFENVLTVATAPIDITLSPAVNLADYLEFWIIINGATVATTDIHMQINNLVSYEYETIYNRMKNNGTSDSYITGAVERWDFTRSGSGTRNLLDGNFYFKVELQGGLPVDGKLHGILHGVYRAEDTNGAPSIVDGGMNLLDFGAQTQITSIKLFTFAGNFKIGTRVSLYGIKLA